VNNLLSQAALVNQMEVLELIFNQSTTDVVFDSCHMTLVAGLNAFPIC
jgi:hypothetical protein